MADFADLKEEMVAIAAILKEYPDSLQPKVFDILVASFLGHTPPVSSMPTGQDETTDDSTGQEPETPAQPQSTTTTAAKSTSRKRNSVKESYQMAKDLNLSGGSGKKSLREFCDEKKPASNIEFNVVVLYYLLHVAGVSPVTIDHIYTCYKTVSRQLPGSIRSSLYDTSSSRYGYIEAADMNNLRLPTRGENLVEHDLPKKGKVAKA